SPWALVRWRWIETRPCVVRLWMGKRESTVSVRRMRSGAWRHSRDAGATEARSWATHIPSLLVVNRWAAAGESGSHRDFRFRHDVWTMVFHQLGERITSIISRSWHFTTKSGGVWKHLPRFRRAAADERPAFRLTERDREALKIIFENRWIT